MKNQYRKLSVDDYIKLWNESDGPTDFAKKTGMGLSAIQARNTRYRQRGYQLKRFKLENPTTRAEV